MSSLNGSWIEIFRAGDYGERGRWSAEDLDRIAAAYNPRLHPAPVVVGHPQDDAPAYGWIARLRRAGQSLWAQLEKVDAGFEKLLREGRFRQRSVALYKNFPPAGAPYLRHVGFLGAQAPAVKGLAPVRFAGVAKVEFTEPISDEQKSSPVGQTFLPVLPDPLVPLVPSGSEGSAAEGSNAEGPATSKPQAGMPAPPATNIVPARTFASAVSRTSEAAMSQSKIEKLFDYLRAFFSADQGSFRAPGAFAGEDGDSAAPVSPSFSPGDGSVEPALEVACPPQAGPKDQGNPTLGSPQVQPSLDTFAERLNQLEQRLEVISAEKTAAEEKLTAAEITSRKAEVASFVESLRTRGQFPPAFDRLGVVEFMERLAAVSVTFTEEQKKSSGEEAPLSGASSSAVPAGSQPLLAWFQEFLAQLPRVIDFRELAVPFAHAGTTTPASSSPSARVVPFTEPRRGMEVDPASIELAERAEAFAAEHGVTYAEALTQLRQQHRYTQSTA